MQEAVALVNGWTENVLYRGHEGMTCGLSSNSEKDNYYFCIYVCMLVCVRAHVEIMW